MKDLQSFVKQPLATLPLTKGLGKMDRGASIGGLKTKDRRVGYDNEWMQPLGFRFVV